MTYYSIPHWNPIEESKDCTTFEGSLQSKMSSKNLNNDPMDSLRAKRHIDFFNLIKVASAIPIKELMKQRIIANLCKFFVYAIESFKPDRIESDI